LSEKELRLAKEREEEEKNPDKKKVLNLTNHNDTP
jgi:hypothetical protein